MANKKQITEAFVSSLFDYEDTLVAQGLAPTIVQTVAKKSRKTRKAGTTILVEAPEASKRDETVVPVEYIAIRDLVDGINAKAFEWYRPQSIEFTEAKAHPTPLMESAALAATIPPIPTYRATLPRYIVEGGLLSESQLEVITLAGEAHTRYIELKEVIPGTGDKFRWVNYRKGFMCGDGAGSGKGRTCVGVILDNWNKGRKRALWISQTTELHEDAVRDYLALGGDKKQIVKLNRYKVGEPIALEEGVIFCTYATLRSVSARPVLDQDGNPVVVQETIKQGDEYVPVVVDGEPKMIEETYEVSRLDQIIEWLGGAAFDGALIFDESQNLQNAMESKNDGAYSWTTKGPSRQALAALMIQEKLPNARIMYASATSGDHLEALAYAPRLGLWGKGTAFPTRGEFLNAMTLGGITALEAICRDLKSMGVYVSRSLSTVGVTAETLIHELDDDQIDQMLTFNKVWRLISTGMEQALVTIGAARAQGDGRIPVALNSERVGAVRGRLESQKQRFYMMALISMRMPTIIADMEKRLAAGEACVLQIHNTEEAALNKAIEEWEQNPGMPLDELDLSRRREIIEFVKECLPVDQHAVQVDEHGVPFAEVVLDPETGLPMVNTGAKRILERLIRDLEDLMVPKSPLDMIIHHFGQDAVAEITGRSRRVIYTENEDGHQVATLEKRGSKTNSHEIEAFMNGDKKILIFSEQAGGTGKSYHADRSCKNQARRNHYMVQIPWRSIDAVQGMGRTNRTNQASFPHYILTTTNVPAEKRFLSPIAKRLDQLGSLTRGQRDANSTNDIFSSDDNLETKYGEAALRDMMKAFENDKFPGMTKIDFYEQTGIDAATVCMGYANTKNRVQTVSIPRFLNRLLAVDIDENGGKQQTLLTFLVTNMQELKAQDIANGKYDAGLQTIASESLKKMDDVLLQVDAMTGAETRLTKLEKIDKTRPESFEHIKDRIRFFKIFNNADTACGFFINPKDGSFAAHIPVREIGSFKVSERIRVITPFGYEKQRDRYDRVAYRPVNEKEAREMWEALVAEGPATERSEIYVVYGALLPVWDKFTPSMPQIWRMCTDDGERILGRRLPRTEVRAFKNRFGIEAEADEELAEAIEA